MIKIRTNKEDEMRAGKMTPKEKLVEAVIEETKKLIEAGKFAQPWDFEGWEKYSRRISRNPSCALRSRLSDLRSGRVAG